MKVLGLVGESLEHSFSPKLHSEILKEGKILGNYNLFSVKKEFEYKIVESLKVLGVNGANVTIPYKEKVFNQLDFLSEEARGIGAVNTIFIKNGITYGYNTDYYGFGKMMEKEKVIIEGNSFFVLGAGGAARSVLKYLLDKKAKKIVLVSRNKDKSKKNFENFLIDYMSYEELEEIKEGFAIINTTPCGMYPKINSMATSEEVIKKFKVAIDLIYNPLETKFLKVGRENGLKTLNGLFMLVGQGVKAEEIWNDIKFSDDMEEKIYKKLEKFFT